VLRIAARYSDPPTSSKSCRFFSSQDHRVHGPVLLVELYQDVEDDLVVGLVEGLAVDDLHDLPDHLLVEHHRGEQAHLRLNGVGRQPVELAGDGRVDELTQGGGLLTLADAPSVG
jgi:hypothetical protein